MSELNDISDSDNDYIEQFNLDLFNDSLNQEENVRELSDNLNLMENRSVNSQSAIEETIALPSTSSGQNASRLTVEVSTEYGANFPSTGAASADSFPTLNIELCDYDNLTRQLGPSVSSSSIFHVSQHRLLGLRIVDIEESLGIYQFAFWRVPFGTAARTICDLCSSILQIPFDISDFKIIRRLDSKRKGVIVRVPSVELKRTILTLKHIFLYRGYHLDIL
ncbi:uncharacterized protein LOC122510651 [Leptopilina heterotoma]|uniref:uncharacterized protein LOC122503085 n=1 Tax=Leptopilina heterotoma TaxID=63436 RepID=UPI001CA95C66|nr:uncharacterized protein LOC122503085 [Leptopilina heterotoma]XP_043473420.1 uncharacterized protein LOC122505702 [Leptopilina heterotoma]XP_043476412.1 uncharacterized protein LOC122507652 [Leptopilina heterotoma]XP_043481362.1 uncharacterized protein LOC122510651 [Leptopilina heterotoma]